MLHVTNLKKLKKKSMIKIFYITCVYICLLLNGCCLRGLYNAVPIHVQHSAYYTWVHRVYSPEEDPVSCFGSVPVSWLVCTCCG